jgi:hypothetical protein
VPVAVLTALVPPVSKVDAQARSFEVASVRQNVSGLIPSRFEITRGGELRIVNMPLRNIIRRAYGIYIRGPRSYAIVENELDWVGDRDKATEMLLEGLTQTPDDPWLTETRDRLLQ